LKTERALSLRRAGLSPLRLIIWVWLNVRPFAVVSSGYLCYALIRGQGGDEVKDEALSITEEKDEDTGVVEFILKGRVDSFSSDVLNFKLERALKEENKKLILNMSQVEYLSSAGIRVILNAYKNAKKAGGKLGIESPSQSVRNVLGMTALDEMLIN
jgi:anti-anti-sigma factor